MVSFNQDEVYLADERSYHYEQGRFVPGPSVPQLVYILRAVGDYGFFGDHIPSYRDSNIQMLERLIDRGRQAFHEMIDRTRAEGPGGGFRCSEYHMRFEDSQGSIACAIFPAPPVDPSAVVQ